MREILHQTHGYEITRHGGNDGNRIRLLLEGNRSRSAGNDDRVWLKSYELRCKWSNAVRLTTGKARFVSHLLALGITELTHPVAKSAPPCQNTGLRRPVSEHSHTIRTLRECCTTSQSAA